MNWDVALENDDLELVKNFVSTWSDIDKLISPLKFSATIAYFSAYDAPDIFDYVISSGADYGYSPGGNHPTVRQVACRNERMLKSLILHGMKPNGAELLEIASRAWLSDIPVSNETEAIASAASIIFLKLKLLDDTSPLPEYSLVRQVEYILSDYLDTIYPVKDVDFPNYLTREAMLNIIKQNLRSRDIERKLYAEWVMSVILIVKKVLEDQQEIISDVIIGQFQGFRRNKSWQSDRAEKSITEICQKVSPYLNLDEDDLALIAAARLIVRIYPIKAQASQERQDRPSSRDGVEFEKEVLDTLLSAGFIGRRTGSSGDQGADIIVEKAGLSYAVQCKNYSGPAGNDAVQQAFAAKTFYLADYAVVCSSGGFTKSAKALALANAVVLTGPSILANIDILARALD